MYPIVRSTDPYGLLRELYAVDRAEYDDGDPPEHLRERRVVQIEVFEVNASGQRKLLEKTKPKLMTYREAWAKIKSLRSKSRSRLSNPNNKIKVVGKFFEDGKMLDISTNKF